MQAEVWLDLLRQERAIAVIRAPDLATGIAMGQAMAAGGLRLLEVTWGSATPDQLVRELRAALPDCVIGAGTIRHMHQLEQAQQAGAAFIFAPGTDAEIIQATVQAELPMIPGALTPSEILLAARLGATCVKVFPIQAVGAADYLQSLRIPLAGIPLVPTGGVRLANAASMLEAGAIAVGMAGELFPASAIVNRRWDILQSQAEKLVQSLMPYRQI